MLDEKLAEREFQKVFLQVDKNEYIEMDMSLPLQMLFDDVITFVSKIET